MSAPTIPAGPAGPAGPDAPAPEPPGVVARTLQVAEREFVESVRSRSFRTGTLVTVLVVAAVIAGVSVIPALFGDDEVRLGALPDAAPVLEALPAQTGGGDDLVVDALSTRAAAEQALAEGEVEVVLLDSTSVLVEEPLGFELRTTLETAASTANLARQLDASPAEIVDASAVSLVVVEREPVDPALAQRRTMILFGVFLAMGQVMGGAFMVAYGVTEEKASRVVEVVVAKTRPRVLLTGKLLGLGAVNLLQLTILATAALIGVTLSPDLSIPPGLFEATGMILVWFLLAYAIFASLFSIAGALTARQEDMQQKVMPAMYLLFVVFAVGFYAFNQPSSTFAVVASYVPLSAPAVMPVRDAVVGVALWEQLLAVGSTLLGAAAAVWIAGAVYCGGALRLRGTSSLRQALRSAAPR